MLIDLYIGILLWLLVNGICMIVGYFIGRGSVWAEINRNGGITREDGEEDKIGGEIIIGETGKIIRGENGRMIKVDEYGISFYNPETGKWQSIN